MGLFADKTPGEAVGEVKAEIEHAVAQAKAKAHEVLSLALGKPEVEGELQAIAIYVMDQIRQATETEWPAVKLIDGALVYGEKAIAAALAAKGQAAAQAVVKG